MRNLLKATCMRINYNEVVAEYEEMGFTLVSSHVTPEQAKWGEITLTFQGEREDVAELSDEEGHHSFLEFDDGTTSPLYIKRERNFWED